MVSGKTSCVIISTTFFRNTSSATTKLHVYTCSLQLFGMVITYLVLLIQFRPSGNDVSDMMNNTLAQFDTLRQLNIWATDEGVLWSICATLINVFFLICKYTGKVVNVDFPKHLRSTLISFLHTFKRWQVKRFFRHVQCHLKYDNNCETTL